MRLDITTVADGRKRREIDPTVTFLKSCVADLETDRETPPAVKARIGQLLEFTAELSGWYDKIKSLPRSTLLNLLRMGAGIGKLVGR